MEGVSHVENRVYVAVGKNVKEGKSLLSWAVKRFKGWSVCLLHVHQATHLVSLCKLVTDSFQVRYVCVYQLV